MKGGEWEEVAGAIRSLVNVRGLLVLVLFYGRRRRGIGLGLYRWIIPRGWIMF